MADPSENFNELMDRVSNLEKQNAQLNGKLSECEKEIEQLKRGKNTASRVAGDVGKDEIVNALKAKVKRLEHQVCKHVFLFLRFFSCQYYYFVPLPRCLYNYVLSKPSSKWE